jgi:nitroimidazol reductase NimA-like FMN-containing flavoprotein (pyridoxamine 5'-phosphate oxidase superfamily)
MPGTSTSTREIVELSVADATAFLSRIHTGRIACSLHDRIDIEPISYSFENGWIFGRTSVGTKLAKLAHNPWCAFEVDEVRGQFDWTSVVVKGAFSLLDPMHGSPDVYAHAMASVKGLTPDAFSPMDPVPHRSILFGIYVSEITGRHARRHSA